MVFTCLCFQPKLLTFTREAYYNIYKGLEIKTALSLTSYPISPWKTEVMVILTVMGIKMAYSRIIHLQFDIYFYISYSQIQDSSNGNGSSMRQNLRFSPDSD